MVLGGKTGSGKSEVLRAIQQKGEQVLDLEKLANHKGSAFGGLMMGSQPTTEQFQNELFEEIFRLDPEKRIWIEDESIAIGKIFLPDVFWKTMRSGILFRMEVSKEIRIKRLVNEYGHADQAEFLRAMEKITRKLGGQNLQAAREKLLTGDMASTIEILLTYYDRAYSNGLEKRAHVTSPAITWDGKNPATCAVDLMQLADALVAAS
jgi:tRNA 2-selenouridine synthase